METEGGHASNMALASEAFKSPTASLGAKVPRFGREVIFGARKASKAAAVIDVAARGSYLEVMLDTADHFRFVLLNRPLPRAD